MSDLGDGSSRAATASVARASYGRLLAYLATRFRDVAAAEDALADAFAAALETWPRTGVPAQPEAWLLTVARRKLVDAARAQAVRQREDLIAELYEASAVTADVEQRLGDDRLRLMLVCAHPAIDATVRPALILQTVLGLEVKEIASAFLLSPDTLNKRLVRAKAKIRATGMRFEEPQPEDLAPRLHALLEAIYAAYFLGREGALVDGDSGDRLSQEAVYLATIVARSLPSNAEALGFHALLQFCEARRPAQIDAEGEFVPLLEQDSARWNQETMRTAYELLARAAALGTPGPFQIEAAIQAAHCYRAHTGSVPWNEIATLYRRLVAEHPTIGAIVGMAVAVGHAERGASHGLEILDGLEADLVRNYQPYWVARSHLLVAASRSRDAVTCLERALGLTAHPRLQRHIQRRLTQLRGSPPG